MTTMITGMPATQAPDGFKDAAASDFRLLGLWLAAGVPALFWTSVLALVSYALEIAIDARHLTGCALVAGAWCFTVASVLRERSVS